MGSKPLVGAGKGFHRPLGVAIIAILMIIGGCAIVLAGIVFAFFAGLIGTAMAGPVVGALGAALGIIVIFLGVIWLAAIVVLISIVGSIGNGYVGPVVGGLIFVYLLLVKKHFNQ